MNKNRVRVALDLAKHQGAISAVRYYLLKVLNGLCALPSSVQIRTRRLLHPVTLRTGNSSDLDVFRAVVLGDEYEFLKRLRGVRQVIDLGANIGLSSAVILSHFRESTVLAVEPEPGNCAQLRKNLSYYSDRAVVLEGAVWPSCGEVSLNYRAGDGREWATAVTDGAGVRAYSMQELLSHFGEKPIDLLKIDIEGSELPLFCADTSWVSRIRNLCIELHSRECAAAFRRGMQGYKWKESRSGEYVVCEAIDRNV
jgi:FkbM family methyltransferase